jgi:hypothetical protein
MYVCTYRSYMLPTHYELELLARERQEALLAEARQDRQASAADPWNATGRRSPFASVLETVGRFLIDAGETLRRAAHP